MEDAGDWSLSFGIWIKALDRDLNSGLLVIEKRRISHLYV